MGNNYDTQRMGNVFNIEEGFTSADTRSSSGFEREEHATGIRWLHLVLTV